jgi:hypothetical protein
MKNLLTREYSPKLGMVFYCLGNRSSAVTTGDFDKFLYIAYDLRNDRHLVFKSATELFCYFIEEIPATMQGVVFYECKEISQEYFYELADAHFVPTYNELETLNTIEL